MTPSKMGKTKNLIFYSLSIAMTTVLQVVVAVRICQGYVAAVPTGATAQYNSSVESSLSIMYSYSKLQ